MKTEGVKRPAETAFDETKTPEETGPVAAAALPVLHREKKERVTPQTDWALINCEGKKFLHLAAEKGNLEDVQKYIQILPVLKTLIPTAQIDSVDSEGNTALHLAAKHEQLQVVQLLLEAGANVNVKGQHGATPLHFAALGAKDEVMDALISKGAELNARDATGRTPLHYGYWVGSSANLILQGADKTLEDRLGATPEDYRNMNYGLEGQIEFYLSVGSDLTARHPETGQTLLHFVADAGPVTFARKLLERGADMEACDDCGHTPLYEACSRYEDTDMLEFLLDSGAKIEGPADGSEDGTPIEYATIFPSPGCIMALAKRGARLMINDTDYTNYPLHFAILNFYFVYLSAEIITTPVDYYLSQGVDVNTKDEKGNTALHFLVAQFSQITKKSDAIVGFCPKALNEETTEWITKFKQAGADLTATNEKGQRPLDLIEDKESEIARMLKP